LILQYDKYFRFIWWKPKDADRYIFCDI
jgi:hypothetical protein